MPLPQRLARFNARVTNKVTGPFAGRLPGFGVVRHVGRRSGRTYETPVNLFRDRERDRDRDRDRERDRERDRDPDRDGDRFVVALTYGAGSQWVRNVLAAGGCTLRVRGADIEVTDPVVFTDPERRAAGVPARWILGAIGVEEFMRLTPTAGGTTASRPPGPGRVHDDP